MEEREIDLRDYVKVIVKRKWMILVICIVFVVVSFVGVLVKPKTFKATAVIQTDFRVEDMKKKKDLGATVMKICVQSVKEKLKDVVKVGVIKEIKIKDDNPGYTEIIVESSSPEIAQEFCLELTNEYISYGERYYDAYNERIEFLNKEIAITNNRINNINNSMLDIASVDNALLTREISEINQLQKTLNDYRRSLLEFMLQKQKAAGSSEEEVSIIEKQIANIESDIVEMEEKIKIMSSKEIIATSREKDIGLRHNNILRAYMAHLNSLVREKYDIEKLFIGGMSFKIVSQPKKAKPVDSKNQFIIIVAGLIGLIFGSIVAFSVEYWKM